MSISKLKKKEGKCSTYEIPNDFTATGQDTFTLLKRTRVEIDIFVAEGFQDPDRLDSMVSHVQNMLPVVLAHARATGCVQADTIRYNQRVYGPLTKSYLIYLEHERRKLILPDIHVARIYRAWNNAIATEEASYAVWLQEVSKLLHTQTHLPTVLIGMIVGNL